MGLLHDPPARTVGRTDGSLPTLGYALLSLLARQSSTGYQLAQKLNDPIGFFWEASHSQIYPQLAMLERVGHAVSVASSGRGPRPVKTYSITGAGMAALRTWISLPKRRWGGRDELLLKVYASWVAEHADTLRLVRAAEAHHAARLALYLDRMRSARKRGADAASPREPLFGDYVTLRRGVVYERGRLAWCRWLIRRLQAAEDGQGTPRRGAERRRARQLERSG